MCAFAKAGQHKHLAGGGGGIGISHCKIKVKADSSRNRDSNQSFPSSHVGGDYMYFITESGRVVGNLVSWYWLR